MRNIKVEGIETIILDENEVVCITDAVGYNKMAIKCSDNRLVVSGKVKLSDELQSRVVNDDAYARMEENDRARAIFLRQFGDHEDKDLKLEGKIM